MTCHLRKLSVCLFSTFFLMAAAGRANAADTIEILGDIAGYGMPVVAGAVSWHKGDREGVWQLTQSWAVSIGATYGLKYLVDSERPNGDGHGFPSAHTTSTFVSASYLHHRYGIKKAWPAYLVAGFTGWSRIHADEHDWEDVIGGAIIGFATGWIFTDRFEDLPPIQVSFNPKQNAYSISTRFRF